jgi:hypothetical protein
MSWFTDLRDTYEQFQTAGLYNPKKSRREEADQRYMIQDQMKAYKDQAELTRQEIDRKRSEGAAEKRRVEEKQIRGLRRNYRPAGLLGSGASPTSDTTTQLGG